MRSKTIRRFFYDLGITQMFSRPRTPADNATIESFFATINGERLYHGIYSNPIELISDADAFVIYCNEARLHMEIVTRPRSTMAEPRRSSPRAGQA
jgi:transposase InsO family protein